MKGKNQEKSDHNEQTETVDEIKMFGVNFRVVLGWTIFFVTTSLIGMFYIAEGWEMYKLLLQ